MAGTVVGAFTRLRTNVGRPKAAKLVLTCTADSVLATYPSTVLNNLTAVSGLWDIRGMMIRSLKAIPSAVTAPTDKSSLTIKDEYGIDLLDEAGDLFIPATGTAWTINTVFPALITGDVTLAITGNLVASAIIVLVLDLIGT